LASGQAIYQQKRPVVDGNNSNNNQGHEKEDSAPHSVVLKKITDKAHNLSLEKGCFPQQNRKSGIHQALKLLIGRAIPKHATVVHVN